VIDIEGSEKVPPLIIDECTKAPPASFWQKLKAEWNKVKAQARAERRRSKRRCRRR
jgi:acid stress chaperone HdeA